MDAESLVTMGILSNNGMVVANLGYSGGYQTIIHDLIELISPIQLETDILLTLYDAIINIETNLQTETDITTRLTQEVDLESPLQILTDILTRLVLEYSTPSL